MTPANSTVLITGASSGIGEALALRYARAGCRVGLVARRADKLAALAARLRDQGAAAAFAEGDVASRDSIVAAVGRIREELGPVDLAIANAGVGLPTRVEPFNIDEIEQTFQVNTMGVVNTLHAVLPEMMARKAGHFAAISSLAAFVALPGESAYCASKAAVNVFLDGLRMQLADNGIAVTCVCPGFVKTPMTEKDPYPQPFCMGADRAADIIYRGIHRKKRTLRFPWQTSWMMRAAGLLPPKLLKWAMGE